MAEIKITGPQQTGRPSVMQAFDPSKLVFPTKKSTPSKQLEDYLLFIYGEKKIGKSTLAASFPNALHLFFEPGGKGMSTYAMSISLWAEYVYILDKLAANEDGFADRYKNVVIDTVDAAYEYCFEAVCLREGMSHPSDNNDFGKSWSLIRKEFERQFKRLLSLRKGVIVVSHAVESEIRTRNMGTWTKIIPTLPTQAVRYITGVADLNAYYGYYGGDRRLVIDGSEYIEAGNRMTKNFRTPDGHRVTSVPMGVSEEEAFVNLQAAFSNLQAFPGSDVHDQIPQMQDRTAVLKPKGRN